VHLWGATAPQPAAPRSPEHTTETFLPLSTLMAGQTPCSRGPISLPGVSILISFISLVGPFDLPGHHKWSRTSTSKLVLLAAKVSGAMGPQGLAWTPLGMRSVDAGTNAQSDRRKLSSPGAGQNVRPAPSPLRRVVVSGRECPKVGYAFNTVHQPPHHHLIFFHRNRGGHTTYRIDAGS
jgi:hypothetical protein